MFETKEVVPEKRKKRFYHLALGYWIALPVLNFISLLMIQVGSGQSFEQLLSENFTLTLNIIVSSINLILAYLLYAIDFSERKKGGIADIVFKIAIFQQLLVNNVIGAVLAFLALRELVGNPVITDTEENEKKPVTAENKKGIMILLGAAIVLSLGIAYVNWNLN